MKASLFELQFKSGQFGYLEEVVVMPTYAGLLEGRPSLAVNEIILRSHESLIERYWPQQSAVVLNFPELIIAEVLPDYWMIGKVCVQPESEGNYFVAVWFQNELDPILSPSNAEHLRTMDGRQLEKPASGIRRWLKL